MDGIGTPTTLNIFGLRGDEMVYLYYLDRDTLEHWGEITGRKTMRIGHRAFGKRWSDDDYVVYFANDRNRNRLKAMMAVYNHRIKKSQQCE